MPCSVCRWRLAICKTMNCNDCIDQVLELIEREAIDPQGVGEILAQCPDCRRLFDEIKVALASAEQLPIEEPPAAVDAAIVRAAAARRPQGRASSRRWLQAPPWAVAAVALLAVGIGLWAVPTDRKMESRDEVPARLVQAEIKPASEREISAAREQPLVERSVEEKKASAQLADRRAPARRRRGAVEMQSPPVGDEALKSERSEPTSGAANDAMEGLAASSAVREAQAPAPATSSLSEQCRRRIARVEERRPDAGDQDVDPEDALALGRCYQAAGDEQRARAWLTRAAADPKTRARARRALRTLATH